MMCSQSAGSKVYRMDGMYLPLPDRVLLIKSRPVLKVLCFKMAPKSGCQVLVQAAKSWRNLVGAPGFEPGTSCAQGKRATRLRHAPTRPVGVFPSWPCATPALDQTLSILPRFAICVQTNLGSTPRPPCCDRAHELSWNRRHLGTIAAPCGCFDGGAGRGCRFDFGFDRGIR